MSNKMPCLALWIGLVLIAATAGAGTCSGTFVGNGENAVLDHAWCYRVADDWDDGVFNTMLVLTDSEIPVWEVDDPSTTASLEVLFDDSGNVLRHIVNHPVAGSFSGSGPAVSIEVERTDSSCRGRVKTDETFTIFSSTLDYDLTFDADLVDPTGPIGDVLPPGGGQPGADYLAHNAAIANGDLKGIMKGLGPEMKAEIEAASKDERREAIEMMQAFAATDIEIVDGSTDGTHALLHVRGMQDGLPMVGEVVMTLGEGKHWITTNENWSQAPESDDE